MRPEENLVGIEVAKIAFESTAVNVEYGSGQNLIADDKIKIKNRKNLNSLESWRWMQCPQSFFLDEKRLKRISHCA